VTPRRDAIHDVLRRAHTRTVGGQLVTLRRPASHYAEVSTMGLITRSALLLISVFVLAPEAAAQAPQPTRAIVNVTGQLYRAQNNNHYTVFLVTPEGIIISDPINRDFARWLKAEFGTRFKVPVRYVLYTHRDWDHASGGVVFADTAEFVGHQNMLAALAPPAGHRALSGDAAKLDVNRNGIVDRSEAAGAMSEQFALLDYNRDGVLNGAELARGPLGDVHPPNTTFVDRHTVTLGGKRVAMIHLGAAHADDSSVLHFPDERAVFSADVLQVRRLPSTLAPTVGAWIDALRIVNGLDFDHALTGHALAGTKKDAADLLRYFEEISMGVATGIGAGQSLADIQKTLVLEAFKSWERWDTTREAHVAAVYATLKGTPHGPAGSR
jgi:glyoxylase-like metal-dependent hydrolase (beta-lactamase superfamily II)